MLNTASNWQLIVCTLLLLAAVVADLRSKKVPNPLVIGSFIIAVLTSFVVGGVNGLLMAGIALMTATVAAFPLYLLKVIGGGDLKVFIAISPLLSMHSVLWTLFGAIVWGAVLGLVLVLVKKQGKVFAHNLSSVLSKGKNQEKNLTKIPFTIAFLFGFLSQAISLGVST